VNEVVAGLVGQLYATALPAAAFFGCLHAIGVEQAEKGRKNVVRV
jgi:hypothetical protein